MRELLKELLRDATAGSPMGGLRWTHKTTRKLAAALRRRGVQASHVTVARLLRAQRYSLRSNRKRLGGKKDPYRDQQFRLSVEQVKQSGLPDSELLDVRIPCLHGGFGTQLQIFQGILGGFKFVPAQSCLCFDLPLGSAHFLFRGKSLMLRLPDAIQFRATETGGLARAQHDVVLVVASRHTVEILVPVGARIQSQPR